MLGRESVTFEDAPDGLTIDAVECSFEVNEDSYDLPVELVSLLNYLPDCKDLVAATALRLEARLILAGD